MSAQDGEPLKVQIFYVAFLSACGLGFWLATPHGAIQGGRTASRWESAPPAMSTDRLIEDAPPLPTIRTLRQLDVVLSGGCSVICLEADWSTSSALARRLAVCPMVRTWRARGGHPNVSFFRVDATDLALSTVAQNLAERAQGRLLTVDAALVILAEGRIIDVINWPGEEPTQLFQKLDPLTRVACSEVAK